MAHAIQPIAAERETQAGLAVKRPAASREPGAGAAPTAAIGAWPAGWSSSSLSLDDMLAYQRDVWERTILFWDTLRQRADNMIAHERAGKPPLLDFDYELILDARRFERRRFEIKITRCLYHELAASVGAPELTPVICQVDNAAFNSYLPDRIVFHRGGPGHRIADGAKECNLYWETRD